MSNYEDRWINHVITSFSSAAFNNNVFTFGMTSPQLASVDKKVYEILFDHAQNWQLEQRSGYSTELINGKLVAVNFRVDTDTNNHILVDDIDFSTPKKIERIRNEYENYVYKDGKSILFPALGVAYRLTEFREGFNDPRPGTFSWEMTAFSKDRLEFYRNTSKVLTLQPNIGVSIAGGEQIQFGMTRQQVRQLWGEEQYLRDGRNGALSAIVEYRFERGIQLCYMPYELKKVTDDHSPLHDITIIGRDGWQVEIGGIRVFDDDKLTQMKATHEYVDSKKGKATMFPALGMITIGCGEKKNTGNGAEGKIIILFNEKFRYRGLLDMYD